MTNVPPRFPLPVGTLLYFVDLDEFPHADPVRCVRIEKVRPAGTFRGPRTFSGITLYSCRDTISGKAVPVKAWGPKLMRTHRTHLNVSEALAEVVQEALHTQQRAADRATNLVRALAGRQSPKY